MPELLDNVIAYFKYWTERMNDMTNESRRAIVNVYVKRLANWMSFHAFYILKWIAILQLSNNIIYLVSTMCVVYVFFLIFCCFLLFVSATFFKSKIYIPCNQQSLHFWMWNASRRDFFFVFWLFSSPRLFYQYIYGSYTGILYFILCIVLFASASDPMFIVLDRRYWKWVAETRWIKKKKKMKNIRYAQANYFCIIPFQNSPITYHSRNGNWKITIVTRFKNGIWMKC